MLFPEMTTTVLLETMAGKGTEIGRSFEELRAIIDKVELNDKVGVCLDTCHVNDAGYDVVNNLDGVLEEFDKVIGLTGSRQYISMILKIRLAPIRTGTRKSARAILARTLWKELSIIQALKTFRFILKRRMILTAMLKKLPFKVFI